MMDDMDLVRRYAVERSEDAFSALVGRHLDWVYSAALRQVRDPHLAEEVTQATFILLAKKAASLGRGTVLSGWLYRTARYAAGDALRAEIRRRRREQKAVDMESLNDSEPSDWERVAPWLDDALARLSERDRNILLMRFFEKKGLAEIGRRLGVDADTARKRVSRAVEKLRVRLARRGAALSSVGLAALIAEESVQAAPHALSDAVTQTAMGKTAVATSTTAAIVESLVHRILWQALRRGASGLALFATLGFAMLALLKSGMDGASGKTPPRPSERPKPSHSVSAATPRSCSQCHDASAPRSPMGVGLMIHGDVEWLERGWRGAFVIHRSNVGEIRETIDWREHGVWMRGFDGHAGWSAQSPDAPESADPSDLLEIEAAIGSALWEPGTAVRRRESIGWRVYTIAAVQPWKGSARLFRQPSQRFWNWVSRDPDRPRSNESPPRPPAAERTSRAPG